MKLSDLLHTIENDTIVWISTDEHCAEGLYFGDVGGVTCGLMRRCTVRKIYPERYPAKYCIGISIIVDMES